MSKPAFFTRLVFLTGLLAGPACALLNRPAPTPVPTTVPTPTAPLSTGPRLGTIYFIALEDNGASGEPVGCGDSAVPVDVELDPHLEPVRATVELLLSYKDQYIGQSGLYNALHQATLAVTGVDVDRDGKVTLTLEGEFLIGGVCDAPRLKAQLEYTVLHVPGVTAVTITVNGRPLDELLSGK